MRRVYFIGSVGGPIKIGVSNEPHRRLIQLQIGCPHRLQVLAATPGDEANERALHDQFKSASIGGEWFAPVPGLLDLVWRLARHDAVQLPTRGFDHEVSEIEPALKCGYDAVVDLISSVGVTPKQAHLAAWVLWQAARLKTVCLDLAAGAPPTFPSDFENIFAEVSLSGESLTEQQVRRASYAAWRAVMSRQVPRFLQSR